MIHLGDIGKIKDAPAVDCVVGGSPCQDLSVAGLRAGLEGNRSGLFREMVRVIKEMRERDAQSGRTGDMARPRFVVWENVVGAYSSNGGKDFAEVLNSFVRIAQPEAPDVPVPDKWPLFGGMRDMDGRWSLAWRTHDAQYWGVAQRRRRISVVVDLGGDCAGKILFEPRSLSGDPEKVGAERKGAPDAARQGTESAVSFTYRGRKRSLAAEPGMKQQTYVAFQQNASGEVRENEVAYTVSTNSNASGRNTPMVAAFMGGQGEKAGGLGYAEEQSPTLKASPSGGNTVPDLVYDARGNGEGKVVSTITGDHQNRITDYTSVVVKASFQNTGRGWWNEGETAETVRTPCGGDSTKANLTYQSVSGTLSQGAHPGSYNGQDAYNDMLIAAVDCRNATENESVNGTLQAKEQGQNLNSNNVVRTGKTVRRLTPLECERLQGYPDGWTDIPPMECDINFWRPVWDTWDDICGHKHHSDKQIVKWLKSAPTDGARYKAMGNSIALPFWQHLFSRMVPYLGDRPTLGSLFDGVGGFPLCWSRCGGTTLWASEIEPFPVRVTKYREEMFG